MKRKNKPNGEVSLQFGNDKPIEFKSIEDFHRVMRSARVNLILQGKIKRKVPRP